MIIDCHDHYTAEPAELGVLGEPIQEPTAGSVEGV